jgi:hypothetical protein
VPVGAEDPGEAARDEGISANRDLYFANRDMNFHFHLHRIGSTPATSAYLILVEDFTPADLCDRQAELAELAEFSTRAGPGGYLWWRAPAWSGKARCWPGSQPIRRKGRASPRFS